MRRSTSGANIRETRKGARVSESSYRGEGLYEINGGLFIDHVASISYSRHRPNWAFDAPLLANMVVLSSIESPSRDFRRLDDRMFLIELPGIPMQRGGWVTDKGLKRVDAGRLSAGWVDE